MSTPILDKLSGHNIVGFFKQNNNTPSIIVTELCDYYYNTTLDKKELLQLAKEIEELANTLENS